MRRSTLQHRHRIAAFLVAAFLATPLHAQDQPDPDTLRSGMTEMLSLLSFGSVSAPEQAVQVTRAGSDYHVQLPLSGFAAPPNATAEAIARPADNGAWDITSMTFPSAGALGASIEQVVSYTVGRQAIHGRLDQQLAAPSTLAADLGKITLQSSAGGQATEQTIAHMTLDGSVTAANAGRVDVLARDSTADWRSTIHTPDGAALRNVVQHVGGHVSLIDLDRAQGRRLVAAARALMGSARSMSSAPDLSAPNLSLQTRHDMREVLNATSGLLTRLETDETFDKLAFDVGRGNTGTLGRMQVRLKGAAEDQRLNAGMDVDLDELALTTLSADSAAFLPHHLAIRYNLAGLPIGPLLALLQAATLPNANPAALEAQAIGLLNTQGARVSVDPVTFDLGPLRIRASAQFVPRADGEIGADIHIAAAGVDALLAQAQGRPGLQGFLPMVFLAKGMGRAQGDSIVWDISVGGGPLTINGTPFGQPPGRSR